MNALEKILRDMLKAQGAMSVASYMELALQHPEHGYYRVREPIGRKGDFVTSPEISQMFGEMIGVWCVQAWHSLADVSAFALVELGPGRGTMMHDLLRATAHMPAFRKALNLFLIDSDQALRVQQKDRLAEANPVFLDSIDHLPSMPMIILANEFFDAMPVRQFEKTFRGWSERMVVWGEKGLGLSLRELEAAEHALIPADMKNALPGSVVEISPKAQNIMRALLRQMAQKHGVLLVIDYGYSAPSGSPTLQATSKHHYSDIFAKPGEIDLTAHVDFAALAEAAHAAGGRASPVIGQGEFLRGLGIELRAQTLKKHANLPQGAAIDAELHRLTEPNKMGELFKVMEIRH